MALLIALQHDCVAECGRHVPGRCLPLTVHWALCMQIQQVKEVSPPEATAMLEQISQSVDGMAASAWDVSAPAAAAAAAAEVQAQGSPCTTEVMRWASCCRHCCCCCQSCQSCSMITCQLLSCCRCDALSRRRSHLLADPNPALQTLPVHPPIRSSGLTARRRLGTISSCWRTRSRSRSCRSRTCEARAG